VIALGGIPNKVQVGDMGLDGRIFPVGTKPTDTGGMFADDWFPIQVKQSDRVGRPDIDAFQAVMEREGENGRGSTERSPKSSAASSSPSATAATPNRSARRFTGGRVESSSC